MISQTDEGGDYFEFILLGFVGPLAMWPTFNPGLFFASGCLWLFHVSVSSSCWESSHIVFDIKESQAQPLAALSVFL